MISAKIIKKWEIWTKPNGVYFYFEETEHWPRNNYCCIKDGDCIWSIEFYDNIAPSFWVRYEFAVNQFCVSYPNFMDFVHQKTPEYFEWALWNVSRDLMEPPNG